MAEKPWIEINFKQRATTALKRSERGTAILLLNDATLAGITNSEVFSWNYTTEENNLMAEIAGSKSTTASVVKVNDDTYTEALKMDSNANIVFNMGFDGKVVIITSATESVANPTIKIDDIEYSVSKYGATEIVLSAGRHTITKGSTNTFLYCISAIKVGVNGIFTNVFKDVSEVNESYYTAENINNIKKCLKFAPYEVVVISGSTTKLADFVPAIKTARKTGWIASPMKELQEDLASWIKSMERAKETYKAIGTIKGNDCKQYVYFNQNVINTNEDALNAIEYIPSLLGIISSCNINQGCTNYLCSDLKVVEEVKDIDLAIREGQLVLTNDIGGVRIVTGINSLTTLNGNTATEDMQYIETVEAMNLIQDDIRDEFKNTYQGKFKNKYMNQILFIGAVNSYFDALAAEDILDEEANNIAMIDVEGQRNAWVASGNLSAKDWSDDIVKSSSFKRTVFIECSIKILNSMENLKFNVVME